MIDRWGQRVDVNVVDGAADYYLLYFILDELNWHPLSFQFVINWENAKIPRKHVFYENAHLQSRNKCLIYESANVQSRRKVFIFRECKCAVS